MRNVEIERKWLMGGFPSLPHDEEIIQTQGYLSLEPSVVRIRKTDGADGASCRLTIKGKGTLSRTEVEVELAQDQYEALLPLVVGPTAQKRLRLYTLPGGLQLECSLVDEGEPGSFYYAEIEFTSESQARDFVAPGWFGREVTQEPGYTMAAYCRRKAEQQA